MEATAPAFELSPDELDAFEQHRVSQNVVALKTGIAITLLIQIPFMFYEWIAIRDHFWTVQLLRLVFVLPAIVVGLSIDSRTALQRRVDILTFAIFAACAGFIISAAFLDKGYNSPYSYVLVMMLVGVGFVTLWPWKVAVAFSLVVYGMYWIPILVGMGGIEDTTDFVGYQLFISGMIMVILVSQQLRLRLEKGAFLSRLQLQQAKTSLERTNERLKELDQLKTDFFANLSHELRTPLTLSLGPLQSLLKKDHAADEEQHLQALHRNQLRLLGLINQLLDLSKAESGAARAEYSREDVGALVRAIVDDVENSATAKGLQLQTEIPSDRVWLYVDREKLEAVFLNLLSNAFKFTEKGGLITVTVTEEADAARIAVSDTGAGIPEDKLHAIFDRFAQVDSSETRRYAGTGIGLALVKSHVELHRGTIDVQSEEGKGTTFTVTIPRGSAHRPSDQIREATADSRSISDKTHQIAEFQEEPEVTLVSEFPGAEPSDRRRTEDHPSEDADWLPALEDLNGARPRVLVVDDTADMRRYLASLLAPDYEVRTAKDGSEGLAATKAWDPDLVVSDVMMPVMSGPDMCQAIKEGGGRLSRTPVVLVTARVEEQTKLRGLDYGADDYLLKPFLQDELLLRVRNLVTKRRQERALFDAHLALRARHRYIQSDLELARDFQNDLLPELEMSAPLDAHVEFRPADVVGGDFYHLTPLGPNRVRLLLADMVDHGVKAAVRAAAAWPEYTSLDQASLNPAEALARLNDLATSKYADLSGSFLCIDLEVGDGNEVWAEYAQAGKMPFTLVSSAGAAPSPAAEGFMVGLFPEMGYQSKKLKIPAGTRLFLYTDGLYTQSNHSGQTYRESGLNDAWNTAMERPDIRAATTAVLASFDRFRGSTEQEDDVTLIGIEVRR